MNGASAAAPPAARPGALAQLDLNRMVPAEPGLKGLLKMLRYPSLKAHFTLTEMEAKFVEFDQASEAF